MLCDDQICLLTLKADFCLATKEQLDSVAHPGSRTIVHYYLGNPIYISTTTTDSLEHRISGRNMYNLCGKDLKRTKGV